MELTFGAQKLIDLGAAGRALLRTSPSAGARHPLEAYVVVDTRSSVLLASTTTLRSNIASSV